MPDIHKHQSPEMHACIHQCANTHDILVHAIHDCLHKGGEHADAKHIGLMMDCVAICHAAEDAMLRHSSVHGAFCQACATVCEAPAPNRATRRATRIARKPAAPAPNPASRWRR